MMGMQLFSVTSVILVICTFIFVLSFSSRKRHSAKLPPSPWKLPIIGHMHHLIGAGHPHRALHKLSICYGPLVHLKLGQADHIIVSSPEAAKDITKNYELNFVSRPHLKSFDIMTYGCKDIAFAPYGRYWRQVRMHCFQELLSSRRVKAFNNLRDEEIAVLVASVKAENGVVLVNITESVINFMIMMTSRAVIGTKCRHGQRFVTEMKKVLGLGSGFYLADLFPDLDFVDALTGMSRKVRRARRDLDAIFDEIIEEHETKRMLSDDKQMEHDIVGVLLDLKAKPDLDFPFENTNIKAVIFDMFSAGTDTSSTTLVWAMAELMRNPDVMAKVQAEMRRVIKGKDRIKAEDIDALHYLKLVIKETLRLHPPIPFLARLCTKSCQVGGYEIPEGIRVIINGWAIGQDTRYWDDVESFRPKRFEGSSIDFKGSNFEFLPFGSGRRMCPGMSFGLTNVEVPLVHLLYTFDWELPYGTKIKDFDMSESFGATVNRKQNLRLIARHHNS